MATAYGYCREQALALADDVLIEEAWAQALEVDSADGAALDKLYVLIEEAFSGSRLEAEWSYEQRRLRRASRGPW